MQTSDRLVADARSLAGEHERLRLLRVQADERDLLHRRLAPQPREQVEQLVAELLGVAHRRHHEQLHRVRVLQHVREQQRGGGVRPLDVVEDQHHRVLARDERQQPRHGREQAVAVDLGLVLDRRHVRRVPPQRRDEAAELGQVGHQLGREVQRLPVRDAVLDGGDERLVGHERLGVRAAEQHGRATRVDLAPELGRQPRLADPRLAGDEHELARALLGRRVARAQPRHRLHAADERPAADLARERRRERDLGHPVAAAGVRGDHRHAAGDRRAHRRRPQRRGQLARVLEAVLGLLGHRPRGDLGQHRRDVLGEHVQPRRGRLQVRVHLRRVALGRVRDASAEHLVEHAAQRVHVRARVDRAGLELLGRGVVDRAHEHALARERVLPHVLGQPEVAEQREPFLVEQDVRGLDVAVHEAELVRGLQPVGDLLDDPHAVLDVEPAARHQRAGEVGAVDVAHRHVQQAVLLTGVVDRDHARMLDRGRRLTLALEARAELGVRGQL